ncbi:MAG: glycosyltransferase [Bacteroidales bacterium]|nr:glycosyltransferase [Bacteroidales bacterium]
MKNTLAKCIDSLLQQDLAPESYEIILVNDGSTDGSENIAKQYEATYKHIKLIIRTNGGLSVARNTGLFHAKKLLRC